MRKLWDITSRTGRTSLPVLCITHAATSANVFYFIILLEKKAKLPNMMR